jgi:hypothetical protein
MTTALTTPLHLLLAQPHPQSHNQPGQQQRLSPQLHQSRVRLGLTQPRSRHRALSVDHPLQIGARISDPARPAQED